MSPTTFRVAVLGAGPAGLSAALTVARAGASVALIDPHRHVGGAMLHATTVPSKALQAAALSGKPGPDHVRRVLAGRSAALDADAAAAGITRIQGRARFTDAHTLAVEGRAVRADAIIVATGSRPRRPPWIPTDPELVFDADGLLTRSDLPPSLIVLGGGVVACELASIYASSGVDVTQLNPFGPPLQSLHPGLREAYREGLQAAGARYVDEPLEGIDVDGEVYVGLRSGEELEAAALLVAAPRQANLDALDLPAAGLEIGEHGLLEADAVGRTAVPHIYGAGDVLGPPGLASTGMAQGRRAALHALGLDPGRAADLVPVAIYTIPEIASVGAPPEEGARVARVPLASLNRAALDGDDAGFLELVADDEGGLLGVHLVGRSANELIHVGLLALQAGWGVSELLATAFNVPSRAQAYRQAALQLAG